MGASTSTEHKVPNEQREAEALAASTGALPMLHKSFSNLANPQSNAIPLHSLQECFRLTYKNPVACEAIPMPDWFPALLDHLGGSISDLFFVSDKGGVNWVEFVRGYNKCCARMSASVSLNKLLRVFSVTLRKAGSPSNLEFESDDADCKITGSLMPADVLMLLWMCWAMSWYARTSKISNEKLHLRLPDVKHVVLSAIVSCAEAGSGLNVWDCDFWGLGVQLPVGKFQSWVLKTVPGLPDCFTEFAHGIIKKCASQKDGQECSTSCSTSSVADNSSTMANSSNLLSRGMAWAISLTLRGSISDEMSKLCFPHSEVDGIDKDLLYRSSVHGRGLNRFWSNVEGYQGALLMLISATSRDANDDRENERKWIVGTLAYQGFENRDAFYGSPGNLYAITPVFHVYPPTGKEKNFVYCHLHPTGRAYEPKPKPVGIGFGGSMGNERIFVDEDFSKVTIRHHAADKTYQPGSLFPDQGFLPVEALVSEVEVWGLGGRGAKDVQDSYKKREQLFNDQRRKVDLKTFGNWEDSPEKMMMDMVTEASLVIDKAYNMKVMFSRNAFLVDTINTTAGRVLKLDSIESGKLWRNSDVLVFNSWHWWLHTGRKQPWDLIQEGSHTYKDMDRLVAYEKALKTWARWVDTNLESTKTKFSSKAFPQIIIIVQCFVRGSEWGEAASKHCEGQTQPMARDEYPAGSHPAEVVLERVLRSMSNPVHLLNVTTLSQLRKDGHPSVYGHSGHRDMDCSHWCLAGVPATWNQLLYASLIQSKISY